MFSLLSFNMLRGNFSIVVEAHEKRFYQITLPTRHERCSVAMNVLPGRASLSRVNSGVPYTSVA